MQADGSALAQEFEVAKLDGSAQKFRGRITRDGEDAYNWRLLAPKDGDWAEVINITYRRRK